MVRKSYNKAYRNSYHDAAVECDYCHKVFDSHPNFRVNQNNLDQHVCSITHRPQTMSCPLCGDERFRTAACATAHVEGGHCHKCRDPNQGRQLVYNFFRGQPQLQGFCNLALENRVPELDEYGREIAQAVPDTPYRCGQCGKTCGKASSLLQHMQAKHGFETPMRMSLGY